MRFPAAWSIAVVTVAVAVLTVRPREDEIPDEGPSPVPELGEVRGLRVEAHDGLPAMTAARATPRQPSGLVVLGGVAVGLDLAEVLVEIGDGLSLSAERGSLVGRRLTLETVESLGARRLVAARVEFEGGRIRLPGVAVLLGPNGEREGLFDAGYSLAEFVRRLR